MAVKVSPSIRDVTRAELDRLIANAELQVIERDVRVAERSRELFALASVRGRQLLRYGAVGAGVGALVGIFVRRRLMPARPYLRERRVRADEASAQATHATLWAAIIPIAWRAMPMSVRSRVSARTASMVFGLAAPVVRAIRQRRAAKAPARAGP